MSGGRERKGFSLRVNHPSDNSIPLPLPLFLPSSASIVPPPLKVSTNNITNNKKLGKPVSKASNGSKKLTTKLRLHFNAGVIPLGPTFIVWMGIAISILFITAVSFAFIGAEDELVFKDLLNDIAEHSPGVVLIGDNVDVDIDEPAITIRWSILACGSNYTLAGSEGTHGSSSCGIPSMALYIYVDSMFSEEDPTAMYDPTQLPFTSGTSQRPR
ncbi:hypothetical protein EW026_g861 [Hermanssonia centrifuga]|uniref:Uncharacterized protein n=1 Tax=Hermanssonia centrifuga TaxID=98765 RepID=A0A4S4KTA2_9APHY|nr:hypothetical protein EW026_g861 [Hermanssonia centrifuga]